MDHFEAVADGYEDGLAAFITSAAKDGMASLAKCIWIQRPHQTCGRHCWRAGLDRRSGKPAVENSVVVLRNGKNCRCRSRRQHAGSRRAQVVDAKGKSVLPACGDARPF